MDIKWVALHHFHLQRVLLLKADNYPKHVTFCQWFIQRTSINFKLLTYVSFIYEVFFTHKSSTHRICMCQLIKTNKVWKLELHNVLPSMWGIGLFQMFVSAGLLTICWDCSYYHCVWMAQTTSYFCRLCYQALWTKFLLLFSSECSSSVMALQYISQIMHMVTWWEKLEFNGLATMDWFISHRGHKIHLQLTSFFMWYVNEKHGV